MKQGWEIKKIKEVSALITDGDWIESKHQSNDGIRLIQTGNIGNGTFKAKEDKPHYISESTFKELGCTEIFSGDCLVSRLPEPVGRACIVPEIGSRMITAVDCSIIRFDKNILPKLFIYYSQSSSYQRDINNNTTGTTRKRISRKNLEAIPIPVPPLPEQEKIVAELDCLSGIIEKKRQQLKELDALAQSIFYEMFGDPVTNEKGWEVKKLGEVGALARGVSKHRPRNAPELLGGNIPLIQTGDIANSDMYIKSYKSTYSEFGLSQSKLWPSGTLCITIAATIGKCSILTFDSCFPDSVVGYIVNAEYVNNEYIYYIFGRLQKILEDNAPAVAQKNINLQMLNELTIPLPPLPLQQTFASKMEAIEKQKELIKQSINEVETLFNSRMQEYFG